MRQLCSVEEVMHRIKVIRAFEEDRYSDIPKWDGWVENWTENAVLLWLAVDPQPPATKRWIPISQLRKAEDDGSVYASLWILDQKGL